MINHKEVAISPEDLAEFKKNIEEAESAFKEISSSLTDKELSLEEREEAAILFEPSNNLNKILKELKKLILD